MHTHTHTHINSVCSSASQTQDSNYINTIKHWNSLLRRLLPVNAFIDRLSYPCTSEQHSTNALPARNNSVFLIICCENSSSGGLPAPSLYFPHCKSWWNGLQVSGLKNTLKGLWATDTATAASLLLRGPLLLFIFCLVGRSYRTSAELDERPTSRDQNFTITAWTYVVLYDNEQQ